MKKNLLIIILAISSIAALSYGYLQKQKAEEQEALAKSYAEKIKEHQIIVEDLTISLQKERELVRKKAELAKKNYVEISKLALEHTKKMLKEFEENK